MRLELCSNFFWVLFGLPWYPKFFRHSFSLGNKLNLWSGTKMQSKIKVITLRIFFACKHLNSFPLFRLFCNLSADTSNHAVKTRILALTMLLSFPIIFHSLWQYVLHQVLRFHRRIKEVICTLGEEESVDFSVEAKHSDYSLGPDRITLWSTVQSIGCINRRYQP